MAKNDDWTYDYPPEGGYPRNPGQGQGAGWSTQQNYAQQPYGAYPSGGGAPGRSPVVPIVAGVVAVALIAAVAVLAVVWMSGRNGGGSSTASPTSTTYVTESNDSSGTTQDVHSTTVVSTAKPAPERPSTPAGATPCSDSGASLFGRSAIGSHATTCGFADAVRDAYAASGAGGGARTVSAYSPTTYQTYSMSCSPAGTNVVQCTGGNNAVVYVY